MLYCVLFAAAKSALNGMNGRRVGSARMSFCHTLLFSSSYRIRLSKNTASRNHLSPNRVKSEKFDFDLQSAH